MSKCEELEDYLANLTSELVKRKSVNPPGEEKEVAEYIYSLLKEQGIKAEMIYGPYKNRPQVVGFFGSKDDSALILNGHMDVVPEGEQRFWKYEPYGGKIINGKVYGRGAVDMKGGLALMLTLPKVLQNFEDDVNLVLTFAIGEETGEEGTKEILAYLKRKNVNGRFGIVLEPTELKVLTAHRGDIRFDVTVFGKAAHSSRPDKGINSIIKAMKIVEAVKDYNDKITNKKHYLLGNPVCSVTMINAGIKINVIPDVCNVVIDRRTLPNEKIDDVIKEFDYVLSSLYKEDKEFKYELSVGRKVEGSEIPANNEYAELLRRISRNIANIDEKASGCSGWTDMRNFVNDAKIPAVIWGPGNPANAHVANEYIEVKQIVDALKISSKFTLNIFGKITI